MGDTVLTCGELDDTALMEKVVATSEPLPPRLLIRLGIHILLPVCAAFSCIIVDRSNLAVALLGGANNTSPHGMGQPVSVGGLGLTQEAFGLAAGIFFIGYALMQMPSNHLLIHHGARRVLGLCTLTSGLFSASTGLTRDVATLAILRFCLGMVEAGFFPGAVLYITQWFPDRHVGAATALLVSAASLGTVFGTMTSGALASVTDGVMGYAGWRWLFICQGLPTALVGVALLLLLTDTPKCALWLSPVDRKVLIGALDSEGRTRTAASIPRLLPALRYCLGSTRVNIFACQYFVTCVISYIGTFFVPRLVQEVLPSSATLYLVGVVAAAPSVGNIFLSPLIAWLVEQVRVGTPLGRRMFVAWTSAALSTGCLLAAGCVLLGSAVEDKPNRRRGSIVSVMFVLLSVVLLSGFVGPFWSLFNASVPPRYRPVAIAYVNAIGNLGGFAGPFVLGWLHDTLGPRCLDKDDCIEEYGWGAVIIAGAMLLTCGAATAAGLAVGLAR